MSEKPQVVIASAPEARALFEPAAAELEKRGVRVAAFYGREFDCVDREALAEAKMLFSFAIAVGAAEFDAAPELVAVASPILGYEWIDEAAATARGIAIVNGLVPENYESMAEAAVMLILVGLYDLPGVEDAMRTGGRPPLGRMVKGRTIGLVGYGNIARSVVDRLQGWGAQFLVHRRREETDPRVRNVPLDTLLEQSDVVLVLANLNAGSRHLIGASELTKMKRDAILINLARGGLIDEEALIAHVAGGGLARVILDVFETEPLPAESALRTLPDAILTPHAIGHTHETFSGIPRVIVSNAQSILDGHLPESLCNADVAARWKGAT